MLSNDNTKKFIKIWIDKFKKSLSFEKNINTIF